MNGQSGKVYSLMMRDIDKELKFFLYDFYDFPIANEIKCGRSSILSEPIKLINCIHDGTTINGQGFLDIGCNIGQFSLVAAAYGYDVYSFDADKINIQQLNKSADINNLNLHTVCALVSDSVESSLSQFGGPCGNIFGIPFDHYAETHESENVGSIVIDQWWEAIGKPKIDVIKMDIEGAEFLALNGMTQILSEFAPPVYCEYNYAYTPYHKKTFAEFISYFEKYGYKPYLIKRKDTLYEVTTQDLFNCNGWGNYLFIHKDSAVLKDKIIIPYPVRDIRDFADHAIYCAEARYQVGFGMELLNNYELLKGTPLLQKFYNSLKMFKAEQSHIPLTVEETALVTDMLKKLEEKFMEERNEY